MTIFFIFLQARKGRQITNLKLKKKWKSTYATYADGCMTRQKEFRNQALRLALRGKNFRQTLNVRSAVLAKTSFQ